MKKKKSKVEHSHIPCDIISLSRQLIGNHSRLTGLPGGNNLLFLGGSLRRRTGRRTWRTRRGTAAAATATLFAHPLQTLATLLLYDGLLEVQRSADDFQHCLELVGFFFEDVVAD